MRRIRYPSHKGANQMVGSVLTCVDAPCRSRDGDGMADSLSADFYSRFAGKLAREFLQSGE
jgi:predicted metal-binding transcription factor (methanogenesis marker protein 9)